MKHRNKDRENRKIVVGITHGDINGIGYEVIIKTLANSKMIDMFTPVVYGSSKVASYHKKMLNIQEFNFNLIKKADMSNPKRANIINCFEKEKKIELGKSTKIAGEAALLALEKATEDLEQGLIDVLVTAPINKKNMQSDEFNFPGHTEYLARKFKSKDFLMLMVSNNLRIGIVTGHIPLQKVSENLTKELILRKIELMNKSLKEDFAIRKPKIALLGLNPHSGDEGLLGSEEQKTIIPAIKEAFDKGILAYGPFPSDGFFGTSAYNKFDGILAMYHDQGLIPFKVMSFENGVNFTAGLPIIRTSPDHGTAYDIAGKDQASPTSLREAIYLAMDIYENRKMHRKITAKPLEYHIPQSANIINEKEEGKLPEEPEEKV